mgnify:CR=1 FL=1
MPAQGELTRRVHLLLGSATDRSPPTQLLGAQGPHNVGLILAESFDPKTKKRRRPFETVQGLAKDLGLTVDVECEVDDAKCVRRKVDAYARAGGKGDVVVCWVSSRCLLSLRG